MGFVLGKVQFVTVDLEYLKKLYLADSEVFYSETNDYNEKPFVGMLVNNNGFDYVIPLTSAKKKHSTWDDVTATNYLVYEEVWKKSCGQKDIIKKIHGESEKVKKILSVLEIKKMIPVKEGLYSLIDFKDFDKEDKVKRNRYNLLYKEYQFCLGIKTDIEQKANRIYTRQRIRNKVLPFHCNFQVLEKVCMEYII